MRVWLGERGVAGGGACVTGEPTAGKRAARILLECCLVNI